MDPIVSRRSLWYSHCEWQRGFYGAAYRENECPCYECGRVVVFDAPERSIQSWVKGRVVPGGHPHYGTKYSSNLRITCYSCSTGPYKTLYAADRARLLGYNECNSAAVYEGFTTSDTAYRHELYGYRRMLGN